MLSRDEAMIAAELPEPRSLGMAADAVTVVYLGDEELVDHWCRPRPLTSWTSR